MIKEIIGFIFIITGILDAWKYTWQSKKIQKAKSAKGHSRKFINVAIFNDIVKLVYGIAIRDIYIILTSLIALYCMINLFYVTYLYYPYRNKRPYIFKYIWNSILPNKIRKKL